MILQIVLGPRFQRKKESSPKPVEIVVPPSEPIKDDEAEISDEVVDTSLIEKEN